MRERPVLIPSGEEMLVADVHCGGGDAVLILPGWSGTRYGPQRILWHTAQSLAAQGYTTLRIDFRGRGDSTGSPTATSLDGMIEDALAAIQWLKAQQTVERLHLVGICSGGNVGLGVASLLHDVAQVVCWSALPFMEHKQQTHTKQAAKQSRVRQLLRRALSPESWLKLLRGEANVRGALNTVAQEKEGDADEQRRKTSRRDILVDLEPFRGRITLLYGGSDPEAAGSQQYFTEWCRAHGIPFEVSVIPDAPHTFFTARWTEMVIEQTVQWLGTPVVRSKR